MRSAAHYPRTYIHIARLFWTGTARSPWKPEVCSDPRCGIISRGTPEAGEQGRGRSISPWFVCLGSAPQVLIMNIW